ncbi:MAG TPA: hypothetical protein DDX71_06950 [Ruminococcus sp.]|nr:hypothetical protein [Ruminococcus sp.]
MDFSLSFAEPLLAPGPAQQKSRILATNDIAFGQYGLRLLPEDAALIYETGRQALAEHSLVQIGGGIAPRLIRWFLPSGYLGANYACRIADLVAAFYHLKGRFQELYDEAHRPGILLSDNAILDYMYRLYICTECAGDADYMLEEAERILVPAMRRLLALQSPPAAKRVNPMTLSPDEQMRLLYADRLAEAQAEPSWDTDAEQEAYDYEYRETMHADMFADFSGDYFSDAYNSTRGRFTIQLMETLKQNPRYLIPSPELEDEWARMTEQWEAEDASGKESGDD